MDMHRCRGMVVNAPHFFADPAFRLWLTNGQRKFTWHCGGEPGEWSDVIVLVDPSLCGEGSDSDMPAHIWDSIVEACRTNLGADPCAAHHYMVRLTNLPV